MALERLRAQLRRVCGSRRRRKTLHERGRRGAAARHARDTAATGRYSTRKPACARDRKAFRDTLRSRTYADAMQLAAT
jgi:hypothetical protein